jgi:fructose-1,6-bisphosphatase-3
LTLTAHEPFVSAEKAIRDEIDIVSKREAVEYADKRLLVADTDKGIRMRQRVEDIKELIQAYQSGEIAERDK